MQVTIQVSLVYCLSRLCDRDPIRDSNLQLLYLCISTSMRNLWQAKLLSSSCMYI
jgi:hypothetical protein